MNEVRNACILINTADYCHTTAMEVSISSRPCLRWPHDNDSSKRRYVSKSTRNLRRGYRSRKNVTNLSGEYCHVRFYLTLIISCSVVSAAILVLLKELENACDPALNAMSRLSWSTMNLVSGQSSYVDDLVKAIEQVADTVKPLVDQKKYLRNFFDKAATCVHMFDYHNRADCPQSSLREVY